MLKENSTLLNLNLSGNHFTDRSVEHLGPALITNSRLQHLDLSHNALGEQAGCSGKIIPPGPHTSKYSSGRETMGRNPIQNAGCFTILKSVQENPDSAMEAIYFSDITVNQDFEDLYKAVKEIFPALTVNHGGRIGTFRKAKA
ncbi:leucine-rich repeat-containing protein 74B-like [Notothenia coriiceps]|uniref:Leucine-rich repeat-containing protein 74B-like n=1 Tax=Notothenia coriiceps TaxID=8208 RepID=A0A6I9PWG9_9TELE|nr:PREDICTED: leucine-rich repeat-containing protein 74B-like [Notothenia coriiceps]